MIKKLLFSPAIALMNHLGYTKKFALLALISIAAFSIVVYSFLASLNNDISTSQRELAGVELVSQISRIVPLIQQHRGLSIGVLGGVETMRDKRSVDEKKIVETFHEVEGKLPSNLISSDDWRNIKANWERLQEKGLTWTQAESFTAHTRLIDQILLFEVVAADEYALTLDPRIDSYYLIDTTVNKLPYVIEYLAQLRAYGVANLTDKLITEPEKISIGAVISKLGDALKALEINIDKIARYNPAMQTTLLTASKNIVGSAHQITGLLESEILAGRLTASPEEFYITSSAAIDASYTQLYGSLLLATEGLLKARVAKAENTLRTSIGIALLLLLIATYFAIGIYYAIVGSIQSLVRSAHAFAEGDMRERIDLGTRDELGLVGDSFNKMADGFNAMLAARKQLEESRARAESDRDQQMKELAETHVRQMLFYSAMEELRQINPNIAEVREYLDHKLLCNAMSLTGAKYGAMGLFDEEGNLTKFLTEGISETERQKIGPYPKGEGLLKAFYKESKVARVNGIAHDPRSCGFPPGHPPMNSLLGVPMVVNDITKGVIYLADKHDGEPFSKQDEMTMNMLAGEVGNILARRELIFGLRDSNQALIEEKSEQQELITQLKDTQSHLLQSEKMASIGQLAAGVAHEINNPIGYVYSNLGTLEKYVQDTFGMLALYEQAEGAIADTDVRAKLKAARDKLDIAFLKVDLRALMDESKDGITRVKNIVQNLKDFSHVDASDEWHFSNLHSGIDSTLNIVNNEIKYKANVVKEYGELPEVECLLSQLNQVFMNLLVNAAHAIEERGTITIRTGTIRTGQQGDEVWVEVADTGKGIAPEHIKKIFDPFFTTKPIGKGTGLGLSLAYGIVQKHHGRIEVQSEVGKGTTFRVWLPVKQPQVEQIGEN